MSMRNTDDRGEWESRWVAEMGKGSSPSMAARIADHFVPSGEQSVNSNKPEKVCRCKQGEGLRSTHCPFHGTCNCCHGATCPSHDESERFISVSKDFRW